MIKVVHCKKEPFDIYIGRPSFWGNPFSHKEGTKAKYKVSTLQEALDKYEAYIRRSDRHMARLGELQGKTLGCWCFKEEECHGHILIKLVQEVCDV